MTLLALALLALALVTWLALARALSKAPALRSSVEKIAVLTVPTNL
jgi:hypothetical protein